MFAPSDLVPLYRSSGAVEGEYRHGGGGVTALPLVLVTEEENRPGGAPGMGAPSRGLTAQWPAVPGMRPWARGDVLEIMAGPWAGRWAVNAVRPSGDGLEVLATFGARQ